MLQKTYDAEFKAKRDASGAPTGEVQAIVSVYGNVDLMGDIVVEGAFDENLEQWKSSGDPLPMVWSHDWSNPLSHIGTWDPQKAKNVKVDEVWPGSPPGFLLDGQVSVGKGNPVADWAAMLMAERRVKEFSFSYEIGDEGKGSNGANELRRLSMIEAGPTLKGANQETELVVAKALEVAAKSGRVLSAKNEGQIRDAVTALQGVLESLGSDETKAKAEPDPDPEEETTEPEPITAPAAQELRLRLIRSRIG